MNRRDLLKATLAGIAAVGLTPWAEARARAADRRRATERWIDQHRSGITGGAGIPVRVPWPRWPFFIGFVVAAGWLWRVRR